MTEALPLWTRLTMEESLKWAERAENPSASTKPTWTLLLPSWAL